MSDTARTKSWLVEPPDPAMFEPRTAADPHIITGSGQPGSLVITSK